MIYYLTLWGNLILLVFSALTFAQGISTETFYLQQLATLSEQELKEVRKLIKHSQQNERTLERALKALENLTNGIDRSISEFEGSQQHERALLAIQKDNGYLRTFGEGEALRAEFLDYQGTRLGSYDEGYSQGFKEFQKKSVQANEEDQSQIARIKSKLEGSPPGYLSKIQVHTGLEQWETATRISAQLTELTAIVQALREEMRLLRVQQSGPDILSKMVMGAKNQTGQKKGIESKGRRP